MLEIGICVLLYLDDLLTKFFNYHLEKIQERF